MTLPYRSRRGDSESARRALWQEVYDIAHKCALRAGVPPQDAEDCALAFVEKVLFDDEEKALRPPKQREQTGTLCPAWVCRCALNHARSFRRSQRCVTGHETAWPEWGGAVGEVVVWEVWDGQPGPEERMLHEAAWRKLEDSLARLAPEPRAFFLRHHWDGESAREIAVGAGRTTHAMEQALSRSHQRLRGLLERLGVAEADLHLRFAQAPHIGAGAVC